MRKICAALTFAVLAMVPAADAPAQQSTGRRSGVDAFSAIGSIVRVSGAAVQRQIKHNGQAGFRNILPGEFLYPGDEIRVKGQGVVVEALFQGSAASVPITEQNSPYRVARRPQRTIPQAIRAFLAAVSWPWAKRNPIARNPTHVKGDENGPTIVRPITAVTPSRLTPAHSIAIPADQDHLTISWCGDAAYGEVYAGSRGLADLIDEGRVARLRGLAGNPADRVRIFNRADTKFLELDIRRFARNEVPRPEWITSSTPSDAMTRTAWGAWLLTEGPAEYRFFGLTLLDDDKFELPAAAQYFGAAVDCGD